jgi:hypothetical protein
MKKYLILLASLALGADLYAQNPSPAPAQKMPIVIKGGIVHVGNSIVIPNAELRIENGKITYVGTPQTETTTNVTLIDATGKHIYPGLILLNTGLGLTEVESIRATIDHSEVGSFNPHVRSLIAYNTDSEHIPVTRTNGILLAQAAPQEGFICGTSSVVQLDAWNWEDAAYKTDDGIFMNFPSSYSGGGRWEGDGVMKRAEKYKEQIESIEKFLQDAESYSKISATNPINLRLVAMKGLFDGTKRAYLRANLAKDIISGVQLLKKYNVKKITVVGGEESPLLTDFLKTHDVSVILNEVFNMPTRMDDDIDNTFKAAAQLQKAGILFSMAYTPDNGAVRNSRNLPFALGMACGFGLDKEAGLTAITLSAAKILGIDDRTGSLEVGKDANVVISEGDILDMRGNQVSHAFIQGRAIDLNNKHKKLNQKFSDKYEIKQK